ncbi:hypothetical protein [Winogradskyella sediminis]|uniref:Uncharacterized protein n=1 Tax=Winogradskyella sediminis TaxID=1382466 RepID=A0A1H1N8M6_9FLAO|nr:hypothetical protein [Winogradskyella sediminis]SDR95065.1 hypothetical protein SAMN04489797_0529 [Winogradskyella sediminis]
MKNSNLHNVITSGFKTPDNYFESFEADLLERLNEKEVIKASEVSGFTVPDDYFKTVENTVLEKLNTTTEKPVITLKPKSTFYYFSGIAASIVLLFSLVFNNDNITIDNLETELIENYLYHQDYSADDLATLLKTDDISVTDFIDIDISDETLDHYFENVDTEDLIFE